MAKTETACGLLKDAVLQRLAADEPLDDVALQSVQIAIKAFNSADEARCLKLLVSFRNKNAGVNASDPRLDPKARRIIMRVRKFVNRA